MSKVATYLNEHLTGEVLIAGPELGSASVDGSILLERPEILAQVANTSDIRKIARFCWQLAEKGHVLPITARGLGNSEVGAAIGSGVVIAPGKYMNQAIGIDPKQRLIHVQAGVTIDAINMTLSTHRGLGVPICSPYGTSGTIGGIIADGMAGHLSSVYGVVDSFVDRLEVVLANGDVLQTGSLSKRELSRKKGLHTMEGEIYRQIDNLITDNTELIQKIADSAEFDTSGYRGIVDVRTKGSFDLTPLFIGSQGSLGVISEVILRTQFVRQELTVILVTYDSLADAQAAADLAISQKADSVDLIDGRILEMAAKQGKVRDFAPKEGFKGGLVMAIYADFNERTRSRLAKKLVRQLEKNNNSLQISTRNIKHDELIEIWSAIAAASQPAETGKIVPSVFRGAWLPILQLDSFMGDLRKLEKEYSIKLPIYANISGGFVDLLPVFDIKKVSDRQKLLKVLTELAELIKTHKGSLAGYGGDGRLKALAMQKTIDKDVAELYRQIKQIFDPHGILNPDIKSDVSAKKLVSQMNAWCRTAN